MLIYSKKNDEGKVVLYGTTASLPDFENDVELVYKDASGAEVTLTEKDVYLDVSADGVQQVKRLSDGAELVVYISSADGELTKIIGKEAESTEATNEVVEEEVVEEETTNEETAAVEEEVAAE